MRPPHRLLVSHVLVSGRIKRATKTWILGTQSSKYYEEIDLQTFKDLFLRGLYFKLLHQRSFKENPQKQTKEDDIHYWSLLEKTGLGVQLTPLAMFIPLLITEQTGEEIEKAASRFRAGFGF